MMQSGGRGALSSPSAAGGASSLAATVEAMKVSELRSRLQAAGHSTDGKKSDLVARFMGHVAAQRSPGSSQSPRHKVRTRARRAPAAAFRSRVAAQPLNREARIGADSFEVRFACSGNVLLRSLTLASSTKSGRT